MFIILVLKNTPMLLMKKKEAGEGKFCPFCKTRLEYEYYQYSHIGKFKCPNCDYGNNQIYKLATDVDLKSRIFKVDDIFIKLGLTVFIIFIISLL